MPAFTRALRDSFVPARIAGVSAIMTTRDYYKPNDVANRLLPAICLLTLDPNRDVRVKVCMIPRMWYSIMMKDKTFDFTDIPGNGAVSGKT